VAPYLQVAAILEGEIKSGKYPAGSRIPTESELVERFEIARSTARPAAARLRELGLVETVPQRGSYVRREA
jgi:DNA-binding GntR family transcriptional regulator